MSNIFRHYDTNTPGKIKYSIRCERRVPVTRVGVRIGDVVHLKLVLTYVSSVWEYGRIQKVRDCKTINLFSRVLRRDIHRQKTLRRNTMQFAITIKINQRWLNFLQVYPCGRFVTTRRQIYGGRKLWTNKRRIRNKGRLTSFTSGNPVFNQECINT